MNKYRVGIYCRVSNDDRSDTDSTSIENQKYMLTDFCFERGWSIIDIYADDGYTGLNFDRPDFKRLIADASSGKINIILVKDLSRFGRSHLECGYYQEDYLPSIGCRFIAVNDGIDTFRGDNDIMPFRNVYNEMYSQDLRKRVLSGKTVRAKEGKYIAAYEPYGYIKNGDSLVIDEYSAGNVRWMFEQRENGMSCCAIASALNRQGVAPPKDYYYERQGLLNPRKTHRRWGDGTVALILKNETYTGSTVQFKSRKPSVRSRKRIYLDSEEWIRCEGTHPAIISREQWERVQTMWGKRVLRSSVNNMDKPLFTGIIKCRECGSNMSRKPDSNYMKRNSGVNHPAYTCGNYKHGGSSVCTAHYIIECVLADIIQRDLQEYISLAVPDSRKLLRRLKNDYCKRKKLCKDSIEAELKALEQRAAELETLTDKLYEEMLLGEIPRETLTTLSAKYSHEKLEISARYKEVRLELEAYRRKEESITKWIGVLNEYIASPKPDSELMHRLIKEIRVGETVTEDGKKQRVIEIDYRF